MLPFIKVSEISVTKNRGKNHHNFGKKFGKPFKPGQVTNPGGRPKKDRHITELCKLETGNCVTELARIVSNSGAKDGDKITAANVLLGYAWGKPPSSMTVSGEVDITHEFLDALISVNSQVSEPPNKADDLLNAIEDVEVIEVEANLPKLEKARD